MKPDAPWLKQPDPYTGLTENPVSPPLGPTPPEYIYDMTAAPTQELLVGPGGKVVGRKRAPAAPCHRCQELTTRRVMGAVGILPSDPGETVFQAEGVPECSDCARRGRAA